MNTRFQGFTRPALGGFHAFVRLARDGSAKPIRNDHGSPKIFEDEPSAYRAIIEEFNNFFGDRIQRGGDTISSHKQQAEAVFRKDG